MVSFAPPYGAIVNARTVELNAALRSLKKRGVKHALIEPVWRGKKFVVHYHKFERQESEIDVLLNQHNWPKDLRGTYKDWGGIRPRDLGVLTRIVNNLCNQPIPVAYGVLTKVIFHNALLTRNLLIGHGFTTATGWYKCVDTSIPLDEDSLAPTTNYLSLPAPGKWRVIEL
jgi:hypothetical protein